ncbi:MAG: hypothetical protein LC798_16805 [Chloroflexi bacterium]|nr:hypothetical protein [Chloroflexota bacterium]
MGNRVKMRNPSIETYAEHFQGGYPEVDEDQVRGWEALGWERVPDDEENLNSLLVDELKARIEQAKADGREVTPKSPKKADLVAALEADRAAVLAAQQPELVQGP